MINKPASVRARLLNKAKAENQDFSLVLTRYGLERLLYRLSVSSNKRFSAADYRQIAIYWLLSFSASIEGHSEEWQHFVLLNPRSGVQVSMKFDNFLSIISSGRTKVEILQLFQSLIGSRLTR